MDRQTEEVWTICAYGVPNRRHHLGTLDELTAKLEAGTVSQKKPLPARGGPTLLPFKLESHHSLPWEM